MHLNKPLEDIHLTQEDALLLNATMRECIPLSHILLSVSEKKMWCVVEEPF